MTFWQMAYKFGWASIEDLQLAVRLNEITADQYKEITKEDYVAPTV
ncbi:XkdX family protein [Cytobacillus massiliigabonensis]|nr:XkdX family protein [Cytobacillus massiliigabonensis]